MISDLAVTRNIQSSCDTICPMTLDIKQFEQHLFKPESAFEILLRGHLWIEALIDRCLEVHIVDANALDLERIGFRQKIDIAQAFGFISQEDGHAFRMVNRLRNKLAHRLMAEPSESEIRDLVSTLAGGARAAFNAARYLPSVTAQADKFADLRYWFFSYAMHLDMLCVRTKYEKDNFVKIMQVEAVLYANKMVGGPELNEKDVRQRFSLEDPPSGGEIFKPKSKSGD